MNITAILQARMSSTRLPGKILMDLCGEPMLWHIVKRIDQSNIITDTIIATSTDKANDPVEQLAIQKGIKIFRGSENNVLERYYLCAKEYNSDIIVRFTGDNPLIDYKIIDEGLEFFINSKSDYVRYSPGLPLGMHMEAFTFEALEKTYNETNDPINLEHIVPYMYKNPDKFKIPNYDYEKKFYSDYRLTVDTKEDFQLISEIYNYLYPLNENFDFYDILEAYKKNPHWIEINKNIEQTKV